MIMKYLTKVFSFITICLVVIGFGCTPTSVLLKGTYPSRPYEITTTKPIDSVWADLSDIFTKNGLPIKKIDKTNGLLRTKKIPINSTYTFEDNNGNLEQPEAWVVLTKEFVKEKQWKPKIIFAQWNVQITQAEGSKTFLKIDPIVITTYYPNTFTKMEARGQSTGKLESLLEGYLK
jgi:hypothetical protein